MCEVATPDIVIEYLANPDCDTRFKHAAWVCKSNRILTFGVSQYASVKIGGMNYSGTQHAEESAICKLAEVKQRCRGPFHNRYSIIIIRHNQDGKLCNSKPCDRCMRHIRAIGIKKVYYSTAAGTMVCESADKIMDDGPSLFYREIAAGTYRK